MSAFLLRRTRRALAGWADTLRGRTENPVLKPWASWGDPRTIYLDGNRMVLGGDGGWFQPNPNGGIAFEHMPLTPNWTVKFRRGVSGGSDGKFRAYLDGNWTAGTPATKYQMYVEIERDTDKDEDGSTDVSRTFKVLGRDTTAWFGSDFNVSFAISQAEYQSGIDVEITVFRDSFVVVRMNGSIRAERNITDSRYQFGPGKRSANFTQLSGPQVWLENFSTYDRDPLSASWFQVFADDFNRTAGTVVGNGWSQGGGQFGILNGALSMQSGFPGDGNRGVWRGDNGAADIRLEATFGGGTGDPNLPAPTALIGRVTADGTSGLGAFFYQGRVTISKWSGAIGTANPAIANAVDVPYPANIANGVTVAFCIRGDQAWAENVTTGQLLAWIDGVNNLVGSSNVHYGAFVRRAAFANSQPINDFRVLVAA